MRRVRCVECGRLMMTKEESRADLEMDWTDDSALCNPMCDGWTSMQGSLALSQALEELRDATVDGLIRPILDALARIARRRKP